MSRHDGLTAICRFFARQNEGRSEAVMTTVDPDRRPHACWMATLVAPTFASLLTITSPDSRKVKNVLQNPHVEWMLTGPDLSEVVYARGDMHVIHEPTPVFQYWNQLPDISRAYFLRYQGEGMAFLLLKTAVSEYEYCVPSQNVFMTFSPAEVEQHCRDRGASGAGGVA